MRKENKVIWQCKYTRRNREIVDIMGIDLEKAEKKRFTTLRNNALNSDMFTSKRSASKV